MEKHKYNFFPEMLPDDYKRLKGDIADNGYDESYPIWFYEGRVLDGWNRERACTELGIEPVYAEFTGTATEAIEFVMRSNKRRNLSSSQWSCIAAEADEIIYTLRQEANERKLSGLNKGDTKPEGELITQRGRTSEFVADVFNTNSTYVKKAQKLKKEKPNLFKEVKEGKKKLTQAIKESQKEERLNEYIEKSKDFDERDIDIFHEDFYKYANSNIKDNSIDAIITDPPYPGEFLYLWEQLFEVSARVLKPSSFLICYSGQMYLDKIFRMKNDLIYYWTANIIFTQKPLISGRNIINEWKPILIFQKPPFKKISDTISDTISFDYSERDLHDKNWGQTIAPFEFLINRFSNPGDLLFEPFAGTGTTLIACKRTKRKCIGTEISDEYIDLIKGRIVDERFVAE
jgi:16S rRNA G966 N2-methylase RsmD